MSKGARRNQLLSLTLNECAKQDIHGAFDWIESAELTPQFKHIYNEVMGSYIEQDPDEAARLVSKTISAYFHYFYHAPSSSQASDPPARSDL